MFHYRGRHTFIPVIITSHYVLHFTYLLTMGVVGAPQMTPQPISSIFLCSPLPSGTCQTPGLYIPDVVFPPLFLSASPSSPFHCALQDGFGKTWWTGDISMPLQFASLCDGQEVFLWSVSTGSPPLHGGICSLCFWRKPTGLAHSSLFCSCVCFCLYDPFNCISFHKFSQQLSAFLLCSSGLISALLALSTISLYGSLPQLWYNPLWLTGLKAPTNQLTSCGLIACWILGQTSLLVT